MANVDKTLRSQAQHLFSELNQKYPGFLVEESDDQTNYWNSDHPDKITDPQDQAKYEDIKKYWDQGWGIGTMSIETMSFSEEEKKRRSDELKIFQAVLSATMRLNPELALLADFDPKTSKFLKIKANSSVRDLDLVDVKKSIDLYKKALG